MNLSDLNNLDLQDAANWPAPIKAAAAIIVFALVVAGGWYLDWNKQTRSLEQAVAKEAQLKQAFESRQRRAANLEAYEQQLAEMEATFGAMLRQLPSQADVPKLLVDVSQTGLASGLEFELFKPLPEIKREFYAELPVSVRVRGNYHQFARFISAVANLPRIVTLHDISIEQSGKSGGLVMNLTA
ncbi:MAG TPA: type 4a pilus biogenesis protein PilO, partial [Gammaproteobacteria bacterium]|nr:type 4a pilus biogenesis protein PilO [Gammaproteobacteria bacterium]